VTRTKERAPVVAVSEKVIDPPRTEIVTRESKEVNFSARSRSATLTRDPKGNETVAVPTLEVTVI
jgi:hypothetical protein